MTRQERNQIIVDNIDYIKLLAIYLSRKLDWRYEEDDLFSEGVIGLIHLIDKDEYNPEEGVSFQSYASKRIVGAMMDYVRKKDRLGRMRREKLKIIEEKVDNNERLTYEESKLFNFAHEIRINKVISEDDESEIEDFLKDEDSDPEYIYLNNEKYDILVDAINEILSEDEIRLIFLKYYEDIGSKDIAKIFKISEGRVSQRHKKILNKLKEYIQNEKEILKEKRYADEILNKINKNYNIRKSKTNKLECKIYGPIFQVIRKDLKMSKKQVSRILESRGIKYSETELTSFENATFKTIKRNIFLNLCEIYKINKTEDNVDNG